MAKSCVQFTFKRQTLKNQGIFVECEHEANNHSIIQISL